MDPTLKEILWGYRVVPPLKGRGLIPGFGPGVGSLPLHGGLNLSSQGFPKKSGKGVEESGCPPVYFSYLKPWSV